MLADGYASRLKQARKALKMLQRDFGKSLGLKEDDMTNLETGRVRLSSDLAVQIEQVHGIDLRWLLTGIGEMFKKEKLEDQPIKAIADNHSIANVHGTINGASVTSEVEKNIVFEQGDMRLIFPKDTPQDVISSTIAAAAHSATTPSRTAITMRFLGPVANVAGRGLELCFTRLVDGKQDKNEIAQGIFAAFQEWEKEFEQFKIDKISEEIVSV